MSSLRPLHRQATQHFDERYKQSESFLSQPFIYLFIYSLLFIILYLFIYLFILCQNTPFGCLGTELWKANIYIWVFFFESSIKLLQVAKFLFMYSFTHTNIVCLFKHLPTEIAIFKNVCYQMKCFSGDSFSFFSSRFC